MRAWGLSTALVSSGIQNFSISPGKPSGRGGRHAGPGRGHLARAERDQPRRVVPRADRAVPELPVWGMSLFEEPSALQAHETGA
jgi:hypothetical protein